MAREGEGTIGGGCTLAVPAESGILAVDCTGLPWPLPRLAAIVSRTRVSASSLVRSNALVA